MMFSYDVSKKIKTDRGSCQVGPAARWHVYLLTEGIRAGVGGPATAACMHEHIQGHRDRSYALKQQGGEIQLSQRGLFHLTVCPCVNDKVSSESWQEPKGRPGKTASGHVRTWTYPTPRRLNIDSEEHTSSIKGTTELIKAATRKVMSH